MPKLPPNCAVLGLEKCSGVDVFMAKMASFMIEILLFQDLRTKNVAKYAEFHVLGVISYGLGFNSNFFRTVLGFSI